MRVFIEVDDPERADVTVATADGFGSANEPMLLLREVEVVRRSSAASMLTWWRHQLRHKKLVGSEYVVARLNTFEGWSDDE